MTKQSVSIFQVETLCFALTPVGASTIPVRMDGRTLLLNELTVRKSRNAAYSLRAFARDLSVSPAALSQYLSRKRELSNKNTALIIERLRLSPAEMRVMTAARAAKARAPIEREMIDEDSFRMISDWISLAVLNLAQVRGSRSRADWISERLGVSQTEAAAAVERLLRLKLISVRKGRMRRTSRAFATTHDVPSAAIKKFHSSILEKAARSLLETPIDRRDITAIVMPVEENKLREAKAIIQKMRRKIADLVTTESAEEVYVLSVQMFPLSTRKPKNT